MDEVIQDTQEKEIDFFDLFDHEILFATSYLYYNKIGNKLLFTIGCELSEWDGERIVELIGVDSKAIIINTCAVTQGAKDASDKIAQKLHDAYPDVPMYVVGCGIDYKRTCDSFSKCLGNDEKFNKLNYADTSASFTKFSHNHCTKTGIVKIQDGCKNNCAYCVVPKLRSHPFSLSYEDIKQQIKNHLDDGKEEIQLVATEVGDYDFNGMKLYELITRILNNFPQLQKLSFNAIDPASPELDKIIELAKVEPRIGNLIELAVQSASDKVLRDMNRRYSVNRLYEIAKLADGKVDFRWHLILGFPTETADLFQETYDNIKRLKPVSLSIFKFSPRERTIAANMISQSTSAEIDERVRIMRQYVNSVDQSNKASFTYIAKYFPLIIYEKDPSSELEIYFNQQNFIAVDLYDANTFSRFVKSLDLDTKYKKTYLLTRFKPKEDQRDLELNCKLLTAMFGIQNIIEIELNDETFDMILNNEIDIYNIACYFSSFIRFRPTSLSNETLKHIDDLLSVLRSRIMYSLERLYFDAKSCNHELADILEERLQYGAN